MEKEEVKEKEKLIICKKEYCDCGADDECFDNCVCIFNDEINLEHNINGN